MVIFAASCRNQFSSCSCYEFISGSQSGVAALKRKQEKEEEKRRKEAGEEADEEAPEEDPTEEFPIDAEELDGEEWDEQVAPPAKRCKN